MTAKIFCRTTAKGKQTFFLIHANVRYYLFEQDYRVSNKAYFQNGILISEIFNFSRTKSHSVKHTLEKLQRFILYIERENNINITNKSLRKNNFKIKSRKPTFYNVETEFA